MDNRFFLKKICGVFIPNVLWIKLSALVVLLIVITNASVTWIFTTRQMQSQRAEVQASMGRLAKQIATIRLTEAGGWYVYQQFIDNIIHSDFSKDIVYIAIFNEQDSLAAFSLKTDWIETGLERPLLHSEERQLVQQLSNGLIARESQRDFAHQSVDILVGKEYLGKVDVGFSLVEFNDSLKNNLIINLVLLSLFAFLGVIASIIVSRRITRPLNRLSGTMIKVAAGQLEPTQVKGNGDEIDKLAETFNVMIAGLKEKRAIEDFGRRLRTTLEVDKILELILYHTTRLMQVENAGIFLIKRPGRHMEIVQGRAFVGAMAPEQLQQSWQACESISGHTEPFIPESDWVRRHLEIWTRLPGMQLLSGLAPIMVSKDLVGYLLLGTRADNARFSSQDLQFLSNLMVPATLSLESAFLLEELKEQEKFKRELEIARSVQLRLLPQQIPQVPGIDIDSVCIPAEEIGGDYLDYLQVSDHELVCAIVDVSGKGASAAFYMAELKGMLLALSKTIRAPGQVLSHMNQWLYESSDRHIFATMIYALYDFSTQVLRFGRAGHNGLILKRAGVEQPELLVPSGIALGLTRSNIFESTLQEEQIVLNRGDLILFYTDGITEARNKDLQEFGDLQLLDLLANRDFTSATEAKNEILDQVNQFSHGFAQHDDLSLIVVLKK